MELKNGTKNAAVHAIHAVENKPRSGKRSRTSKAGPAKKPGSIPSLVAELQAVKSQLDRFSPPLSKEARLRTAKFRKGGEVVVEALAKLAREYGLEGAAEPTERVLANLALARELAPLQSAVDELSQRVADAVLQARSDCWRSTTRYYTLLEGLARFKTGLQTDLQPVQQFFATGPRKVRPPAQA
jgi:hypothetical protein